MYGQGRRSGTNRKKEGWQGAGDGPFRVQILEVRHCIRMYLEDCCKETLEKWLLIGRKTYKYLKNRNKKAQKNVLIRLATGKSKKVKQEKYPQKIENMGISVGGGTAVWHRMKYCALHEEGKHVYNKPIFTRQLHQGPSDMSKEQHEWRGGSSYEV